MTTSRRHTTATLLTAALLSLAMTGTATAATSLTFAHAHPVTDSQHLAAERFAERLAERSAGELTVKIFPNGQLAGQRGVKWCNQRCILVREQLSGDDQTAIITAEAITAPPTRREAMAGTPIRRWPIARPSNARASVATTKPAM